jgi:hypothetical protein
MYSYGSYVLSYTALQQEHYDHVAVCLLSVSLETCRYPHTSISMDMRYWRIPSSLCITMHATASTCMLQGPTEGPMRTREHHVLRTSSSCSGTISWSVPWIPPDLDIELPQISGSEHLWYPGSHELQDVIICGRGEVRYSRAPPLRAPRALYCPSIVPMSLRSDVAAATGYGHDHRSACGTPCG